MSFVDKKLYKPYISKDLSQVSTKRTITKQGGKMRHDAGMFWDSGTMSIRAPDCQSSELYLKLLGC